MKVMSTYSQPVNSNDIYSEITIKQACPRAMHAIVITARPALIEAGSWNEGVLKERKRREPDPTLMVLDRISRLSETKPELRDLKTRVESLRHFFGLIDGLAVRLLSLETQELSDLGMLLGDDQAAAEAIDPEEL